MCLKYNRLASITIVVVYVILTGCASPYDVKRSRAYNQFAIRAARVQLWKEAIFRWKQVVDVTPNDSRAHNNLGVAYEAIGNIDAAIAAYQRATKLEPDNKYYRLNYRRCRRHLHRSGDDTQYAPKPEEELKSTEE